MQVLSILVNCSLKFTPITCTTTTNEDLNWEDFVNLFEFISNFWQTKEHVNETYLEPTQFLCSWSSFKNTKEYFKCEAQVPSPYVLKDKARKIKEK